jgi:Xaa-Pro aminopeptidase
MNPWASDRVLQKGDGVVLDWGGVYNGYWSDLTRVFFIGSVTEKQKELYNATLKLRDVAENAVRPGIPVGEIDRKAMQEVSSMGYDEYVQHRSGHAIGLEMHEMPSISSDVQTLMQPGMCLTIEPALYDWPDVGSFRIEDVIVVTEEGSKCLSHCTRELIVV